MKRIYGTLAFGAALAGFDPAAVRADVFEYDAAGSLIYFNGDLVEVEAANTPPAAPDTPPAVMETEMGALAAAAASTAGLPVAVFFGLIEAESGWSPNALSPKGAYGLTQLMPATARRLGVDRMVVESNLAGGARYLSMMFSRFADWRLALAAYNAGPEAVEKYDGVPPYAETIAYLDRVATFAAKHGAPAQLTAAIRGEVETPSIWESASND